MKFGQIWPRRDLLEEADLSGCEIHVQKIIKKWHFSPYSENVFYQMSGNISERERQMLTTHPQAKVQTLFLTTLASTTLWISNINLPTKRFITKEMFCFVFDFLLSAQIQTQVLF